MSCRWETFSWGRVFLRKCPPHQGRGQAFQVLRIRRAQDPGACSQLSSGESWLILAHSFRSSFSPWALWASCPFKKGSHTLWGPASPAGCLAQLQLGPSWAGFECWTLQKRGDCFESSAHLPGINPCPRKDSVSSAPIVAPASCPPTLALRHIRIILKDRAQDP